MGRKGNRLCNKPAAAPSQVKGRVGQPLGEYPHDEAADWSGG